MIAHLLDITKNLLFLGGTHNGSKINRTRF